MKDRVKEQLEIISAARIKLNDLLREAMEDFFKKQPNVLEMAWHQYTPSFCDGDPCYFYKSDMKILYKDDARQSWDDGDYEEYYYWSSSTNPNMVESKPYIEVLDLFPDSAFESVYGSYSSVLVKREEEGIKVEIGEYYGY